MIRYLNFIGAVIIITIMTACGQVQQKDRQKVDRTDWKTFTHRDYSIQYPDWVELNTSGINGTSFMLYLEEFSLNEMIRSSINLLIQDLNALNMNISFDEYVKLSENQVKTLITGGKIIKSQRFEKDNSEFQEFIWTGRQGKFIFKCKQYYTIKNGKAYVLTLTTDIKEFDRYKTVGTEIMDIFRIR